LAVLLGDEPALEDDLVLYHRLLSGDEEEAQDILDKRFRTMPRGKVFDEVVIPALLLAGRDRVRHDISEADHQHVVRTAQALVDLPPHASGEPRPPTVPSEGERAPAQRILGVSARTITDEAIWDMLAQLFDPHRVEVQSVGSAFLSSETAPVPHDAPPDLVCVISIPPGGLAQARYICRRLRAKLPDTPILVIRPGVRAHGKESMRRLTEDGASNVCFTLEDAHTVAEQRLVTSHVAFKTAAAG
jgi:hypothetical protein